MVGVTFAHAHKSQLLIMHQGQGRLEHLHMRKSPHLLIMYLGQGRPEHLRMRKSPYLLIMYLVQGRRNICACAKVPLINICTWDRVGGTSAHAQKSHL
jgi:hypothetical protein